MRPEEQSLTIASLSAAEVCRILAPLKTQAVEQIKTCMSVPASFTALWLLEPAGVGVVVLEGGGQASTIKEYHPEWGEVCKTRPQARCQSIQHVG